MTTLYFSDNFKVDYKKTNKFIFLNPNIKKDEPFTRGQILFSYMEIYENKEVIDSVEREYVSSKGGYLIQFLIESGKSFRFETAIAKIVECNHGVQHQGLCTICGKNVSDLHPDNIVYGHNEISITKKEAKRIDGEKEKKLLDQRKLALILDLDQTIIHATTENQITEKPTKNDDLFEFYLPSDPFKYYVKFRPGLKEFLKNLSPFFKLHIYTMGTSQYATQISNLMDPDHIYFTSTQIIARDHFSSHSSNFKKNLQHIFPCKDHMAIIIDDREDVWTNNHGQVSENLITIPPYYYFKPKEELNDSPFAKKDQITIGQDKALNSLEHILMRVHQEFYKLYDIDINNENENNNNYIRKGSKRDCKTILKKMRKSTLANCYIVFSGVIPVHTKEPHKTREWKLAESLGATCQLDIQPNTTHVVAKNPGTSKVHLAQKENGIYIVSYNWFLECSQTWKYQDVFQFPLSPHIQVLKPDSISRYKGPKENLIQNFESSSSDYNNEIQSEDEEFDLKKRKVENEDSNNLGFYSTDEDELDKNNHKFNIENNNKFKIKNNKNEIENNKNEIDVIENKNEIDEIENNKENDKLNQSLDVWVEKFEESLLNQ